MNDKGASVPQTTELTNVLNRLGDTIAARHSARIIQLPLWPEPKRGAPNSFIRSALFAAVQGKDRKLIFVR